MKCYSNGLVFYWRPSVEPFHRIGIIASRKTGGAVVRNTFKRRMRELLPSFLGNVKKPYDCIVIATNSEVAKSSFSRLQENLNLLLKKFSQYE